MLAAIVGPSEIAILFSIVATCWDGDGAGGHEDAPALERVRCNCRTVEGWLDRKAISLSWFFK